MGGIDDHVVLHVVVEDVDDDYDGLMMRRSSSSSSSSIWCLCRICHEEEESGSKNLETPCHCSGTLKYAHRKCIQRWCNEKGDTVCEICLQKFEPGYSAPAKEEESKFFQRVVVPVPLIMRGGGGGGESYYSYNMSREEEEVNEEELRNPGLIAIVSAAAADATDPNYEDNPNPISSCCQMIALVLTMVLLVRHALLLLFQYDGQQYAFTLLTLFVLRATGVILPFYVVGQAIAVVQRRQLRYQSEEINSRRLMA